MKQKPHLNNKCSHCNDDHASLNFIGLSVIKTLQKWWGRLARDPTACCSLVCVCGSASGHMNTHPYCNLKELKHTELCWLPTQQCCSPGSTSKAFTPMYNISIASTGETVLRRCKERRVEGGRCGRGCAGSLENTGGWVIFETCGRACSGYCGLI